MNLFPLLGKAVTAMLGRSLSLGLPTMNPALLELSFLISSRKEPRSPPRCCSRHGVLARPSWDSSKQHLSGSLVASRARAEKRGASGLLPHSPGCPWLATVPHRLANASAGDKGWFPALSAHMALLVPLWVMPWTQEL